MAPLDGERALDLLNLASAAAAYSGDRDAQVAIAHTARGVAVGEGPFARMLAALLGGIGAYTESDFATSVTELRLALEPAEELDDRATVTQPLALLFAGRAALYLGDDRAAYRAHRDAVARAREAGALGVLTQVLPILTITEVWAGRWDPGSANAGEGLRLGREIGQEHLVAQALVLVALIAALRGDEEKCRSLAAESRELASTLGLGVVAEITQWALALLELGLGRAEKALRRAREISHTLVVDWSALDRVEAAVRSGEPETARAWLASFERSVECNAAAWARAVLLQCRALLCEDESDAERLFVAALEAHERATRPFEHARTELAFGEFLRRARRRVDARGHLRAALDGFEALGAGGGRSGRGWSCGRAARRPRRRGPSTRDELTEQELQIAHLVAQGLTNREVAAQLFLSTRTIAFHLRNVFRKLDITSRTELARLDLDSASESNAQAASLAIRPVRA